MADSAPENNFVKKTTYPNDKAKPKASRAPPPTSRMAKAPVRPKPATVAELGAKAKKPMDPMEMARMAKIATTIAGMAK